MTAAANAACHILFNTPMSPLLMCVDRPSGRYGRRSKIEAKPCEASAQFGIAGRKEKVPES
jgi:hypothetical protein